MGGMAIIQVRGDGSPRKAGVGPRGKLIVGEIFRKKKGME